jgi:hypothetical protein
LHLLRAARPFAVLLRSLCTCLLPACACLAACLLVTVCLPARCVLLASCVPRFCCAFSCCLPHAACCLFPLPRAGSLDKLLETTELLEVFSRHDADPEAFSPKVLGDLYDVDPELLEYVLRFCRPPVVVENDGLSFGVYEVKSFS